MTFDGHLTSGGGSPGPVPCNPGSAICHLITATSLLLAVTAAAAPLEARFAEPPRAARYLPNLHELPADPAAQDAVLDQLDRRGFGGFVGNVPFSRYVDDPAGWPPFARIVEESEKRGMRRWLYDECGYPSGAARDLVLAGHPEWEARGLLVALTNAPGGAIVEMDCPPGLLRRAVAWRTDVAAPAATEIPVNAAVAGHRLKWRAPAEGTWRVMVATEDFLYDGTMAAGSVAFRHPYVNLLMAEPTARFLEVTHAAYAAHLGKDLGRRFDATFTDEPALLKPSGFFSLPWAPEFDGLGLLADLPALVDDGRAAEAPGARFAFWSRVGDRVSKNYFGQIETWCRAHGLPSGGHLFWEEDTGDATPFYGDLFQCMRAFGAPGLDCLTSLPASVPARTARLAASAAELAGGPRLVMCELSDWSERQRYGKDDKRPVTRVTPEEILGSCYRLIEAGVNTFTGYYQWDWLGLGDGRIRDINLRLGRCNTLMTEGTTAADIAILYPSDALKTVFEPTRIVGEYGPRTARVAAQFDDVISRLEAARRPYTVVDAAAIGESSCSGTALRHGDLRWNVLVLSGALTLPVKTMRRIREFWRSGGLVVALGSVPVNSPEEFPCAKVAAISAEMFGTDPALAGRAQNGLAVFLPFGRDDLLPDILAAVLRPRLMADGPLSGTLRHADGHDTLMVRNESGRPWKGTVRFNGFTPALRWEMGTNVPAAVAGPACEISLQPWEAVVFTGPRGESSLRIAGDRTAAVRAAIGWPKPAGDGPLGGMPGATANYPLAGRSAAGRRAAPSVTITADRAGAVYGRGEAAVFTVTAAGARAGTLDVEVTDFGTQTIARAVLDLAATNAVTVRGALGRPGFLLCRASGMFGGRRMEALCGAAFEPLALRAPAPCPDDFDAFWSNAVAKLDAETPPDLKEEPLPEFTNDRHASWLVSADAGGGRRVYGFLCVPKGKKGPLPAEVGVSGAGSGAFAPDTGRADKGVVSLLVVVHPYRPGTNRADHVARYLSQWDALKAKWRAPLYCCAGAASREEFFYYPVILGANRLVDALAARPDVDPGRVFYRGASQGGGLGFALVALNRHFAKGVSFIPALTGLLDWKAGRQSGWPQLVENQPPETRASAAEIAPYFDGANFAARIRCPYRVSAGFIDTTCPPAAVYTGYNALRVADKAIFNCPGVGHGVPDEIRRKTDEWLYGREGGK